jgi:uncharacterized protein YjbJ (UPF0337 family)
MFSWRFGGGLVAVGGGKPFDAMGGRRPVVRGALIGTRPLRDWRKERVMADDKSGPAEGISGVVEGVKGKAKEAAGAVTGRDDLRREGEAQQDKADAQRDAAKKEAEAESARGAAKASEAREKAEQ